MAEHNNKRLPHWTHRSNGPESLPLREYSHYIYTPIILLDDHYIRSPFDILVIYNNIYIYIPGWWFETFFPNSWDDDPIWLIFFRGVETTNQYISIWTLILAILLCIQYKHIMFFSIYIYIISPRTFPGAIHCQAPGRRLGHALQELWLPGGRRENDGKTMGKPWILMDL